MDTVAGSNYRARRPKHSGRLIVAPTISLGKYVVLPFELNVSSVATNVTTPVDAYKGQFDHWYGLLKQFKTVNDVKNYLINPINRVGTAPKFGPLKLLLGTQTPNYSELTVGNVSMFGAGLEFKTKWLYFSASSGYAQQAIDRDSALNIPGAYQKTQYSARGGIGNPDKNFIGMNGTFATEAPKRGLKSLAVAPQTGFTGSVEYQLKIKKGFRWKSELAASIRTTNTQFYNAFPDSVSIPLANAFNKSFPKLPKVVSDRFEFNPSTLMDWAGSSTMMLQLGKIGLDFKGLYIGPAFKPVGYPFFVSDRFDGTVGIKFSMFKDHLNFNGTFGQRINNVSKQLDSWKIKVPTIQLGSNKISPLTPSPALVATRQSLINANLDLQISEKVSLNTNYSNFGIQNTIVNDSLRVRNIGQTLAITPTVTFGKENATNVITLIASLDQFRDLNVISGNVNDNDSRIVNLTYSHSRKKSPLTIQASTAYFNIVSSNLKMNNTTFTLGTGYKFFKKKLGINFNVTSVLNNQALATNPGAPFIEAVNRQLLFNLKTNFQAKNGFGLSLDMGNNRFSRENVPLSTLNEWMGRVSIKQSF